MLVTERDSSLTYNQAKKQEKIQIVLDWLLEFRFSSIDLLARRIGSTAINSNRFFNAMIGDGLIQKFANVHTNNERYVMLTAAGLSYLEVAGRDISRATTRVAHLGRYSKIMHDLAVQQAVLNRLHLVDEVVWDRNIILKGVTENPDALLHHKGNDYWMAIEYERWRKDTKRIFMSFYNHSIAIKNRHYQGVFFIFDKEVDLRHYLKIFENTTWPRYERKKTGHIQPLKESFSPDAIPNLRKCFKFVHEPVENKIL